jgi:hypothetical protein
MMMENFNSLLHQHEIVMDTLFNSHINGSLFIFSSHASFGVSHLIIVDIPLCCHRKEVC